MNDILRVHHEPHAEKQQELGHFCVAGMGLLQAVLVQVSTVTEDQTCHISSKQGAAAQQRRAAAQHHQQGEADHRQHCGLVQPHACSKQLHREAAAEEANQNPKQELAHQIGHQHPGADTLTTGQCQSQSGKDNGNRIIEPRLTLDQIR
ncbi:MAG: Uncharacterised protein [Cyanobium sp. ARS6]|nr:MAG: Uncharacterised protein [Cyanobium sp. ARS6]